MSDQKSLLTYNQAAKLLSIAPQTLRRWVAERKLPFIKLGGSFRSAVRFDAEELNRWVREHTVPAGGSK